MKLSKKEKVRIETILACSYGFKNISFDEQHSFVMCDYEMMRMAKYPMIGVKDQFFYKIKSDSISKMSTFVKNESIVDAVLTTLKTINGLKYRFLSDSGKDLSQVTIRHFEGNLLDGELPVDTNIVKPTVGFWITTTSGLKIAYVEISDDNIHYTGLGNMADQVVTNTEFSTLLINDYAKFLSSIDEFFVSDNEFKSFEDRMDDIKNVLLTKEMFEY